jgi:Resolvase, N terminal domain
VFVITRLSRAMRSLKHLLALADQLRQCGVGLVVLKQHIDTTTPTGRQVFHILGDLNLATRAGADASGQLKYLAERIPATFIYAGVDVEGSGLLVGTRGRQIAGRSGVITCRAFACGTTAQRQEWQALIATLGQSLRLHRHAPGRLLKLAGYLHERTDGMIGSLSHLIRGAAVEAILDGTEKITRETLDRIGLDHAAETTRTRRKAAARRRHATG